MKKNFLLIALGFSLTSLIANEMPPMPPGFFNTKEANVKEAEAKEVKKGKETVTKVKRRIFPKECDAIPPMLYNFPPPMQVDMDKCTAKMYKPTNEMLVKKLSKLENSKIELISVEESKGFKRLYEVKYKFSNKKDKKLNEKIVYSNPEATKFFINKPIEVK